MKRLVVRLLCIIAIAVMSMSRTFIPAEARTVQEKAKIVPLPPPKRGPDGQDTPNKNKKSDSCYVEVNPPRGCRYPEQHPIGEVCYCKDDDGTHEGAFLAN